MRRKTTQSNTSNANYYKPNSYNVTCDYSGFKVKAEDTKMTWDGYRVAKQFWEARHPQDFTAIARDEQYIPNARPEQEWDYIKTQISSAVSRCTESGDTRITDSGEIRITE